MAIEGRFANRPDLGACPSALAAHAKEVSSALSASACGEALLQRVDADAAGSAEKCHDQELERATSSVALECNCSSSVAMCGASFVAAVKKPGRKRPGTEASSR